MAQENTARVITIAATEQPQDIRLRVAAYARVSSSSDEQLNSFAAQNRYYTELISSKDNWQLVDIYADAAVIIGLKAIRLKPPSPTARLICCRSWAICLLS